MAEANDVAVVHDRVRSAHAALVADLVAHDLEVTDPSRLPGWTIGHLLTHIARNADSVVRRLHASAAGTAVEQYAGGLTGRAAQIEAGAQRPYGEIRQDVIDSAAALDDLVPTLPSETWAFTTPSSTGEWQSGIIVLARREREVVLHHTDLGIGFEPDAWPPEMTAALLEENLSALPGRTSTAVLAGWLTDRSGPPRLSPWMAVGQPPRSRSD